MDFELCASANRKVSTKDGLRGGWQRLHPHYVTCSTSERFNRFSRTLTCSHPSSRTPS